MREFLKKSPTLVKVYRAGKHLINSVQNRGRSNTCPPDAGQAAFSLDPVQPAPAQAESAPDVHVRVPALSREQLENYDAYQQYPPHVLYTFREKDVAFREALKVYSSVSVADEPSGLHTDPNRVLNFFQLLQAANQLPEGDYIELGSHRGFSLRVIHKFMDSSRTLYALDTFEGFDKRDIAVEKQNYDTPWTVGSFAPTSTDRVARYVGDGSIPKNLKLIQGWFPESFKGLEGRRWRFVHIDFDLYQPIKSALEMLWPPLLPGGILMVHDYGSYGFPGARKAVNEFCEGIGLMPVELTDRWSTAVLRKPLRP
jgi:hypothetical protein